jgi:DNA-binding PadR family transcriptional regulator
MRKGTELSQLQLAVLNCLLNGDLSGRDLRAQLASLGWRKSGPAFYQMMSRIEDAGLVKGNYTKRLVSGQQIRERSYRITASGERAWEEVVAFLGKLRLARAGGV